MTRNDEPDLAGTGRQDDPLAQARRRDPAMKFQCPVCRAGGVESGTEVASTRLSDLRDSIVRRRRCLRVPEHTFSTEESARSDGAPEIWIRRSTDRRIDARFSRVRLSRDIRRAVLGRISYEQVERVVSEVAATLSERIADYGQPLTVGEQAEHGASARALAVTDLRVLDEVERSLNAAETRIAHVLYALGVRGAINLAHRPREYAGFPDAASFLSWLFDDPNYPGLSRAIPQAMAQREEAWWSPTNLLFPERVVKRSGEHRHFDFSQFRRSIEGAMRGRSRWVLESNELARWVIVQVEGQRLVTTSQLSVIVSTALRRTDDVAYLRWSIAAKNLTSVAEIADEAEDLITHPSVRLKFAPEGQPRIDTGAPTSEGETGLAGKLRALAAEIESGRTP